MGKMWNECMQLSLLNWTSTVDAASIWVSLDHPSVYQQTLQLHSFLYTWWIKEVVCTSFGFGKMCMCVCTFTPINYRWFIRFGILNNQQWAQEVLTIYTRSVTVHKNCLMIPIWDASSINSNPRFWCKPRENYHWTLTGIKCECISCMTP